MTSTTTPPSHPAIAEHNDPQGGSRAVLFLRIAYLVILLLGFLVAIELMSKSIKALTDTGMLGGGGDNSQLFGGVTNPFAGLALGVLFTVLVQSSSTTTSTIVAVVGSGVLSVEAAAPMIMGANIGTTITNTLVSMGHVRRSAEFHRAFSSATVHDFFNLMAVAVLFPLEVSTKALTRLAGVLSNKLAGAGGAEYKSPIKSFIKSVRKTVVEFFEGMGLEGNTLSTVILIVGIALTFLCLVQITRNMRRVMGGRIEKAMNRALGSNSLVGVGIGTGVTMSVQSSSITTSLLVPMCAAGVLSLANALPVMLGANIGTTVTALLASLAQENPAALTIALVHILFNGIAVSVVLIIPGLRNVPIKLATGLADLAVKNRIWIAVYVLGCFVALPLLGWLLWGSPAE